jgi:hypothetical protein
MINFPEVVGWTCIVVICLIALALAVALAAYLCGKALERFEFAIAMKARQDAGRSLDASAWWFSESPDTSLAIRIIGTRLARGESIDADTMREQWRKAKTPQPPADGTKAS